MLFEKTKIDANIEKNIIKSLIVSDIFINQIAPNLQLTIFQIQWIRIIVNWCIKYQKEYNKAPKQHIRDIFNSCKNNHEIKEETCDLIEEFLINLSDEYENENELNIDYLIDETDKYCLKRSLQELKDDIESGLINNDLNGILSRISSFNKNGLNYNRYVELTDPYMPIEISKKEDYYLFKFPDKLGNFIGPLNREDFLSFFGPNKRGKSWFLLLTAIIALNRKLNVVYFNFEMSINDILTRAYQYYCGQPIDSGSVFIPIFDCKLNQNNSCKKIERINKRGLKNTYFDIIDKNYEYYDKNYKSCIYCKKEIDFIEKKMAIWFKIKEKEGLDTSEIIKKLKSLRILIGNKKCKIFNWPQYSKTMDDINNELDILKYRDGFIPDIVITDLADRIISKYGKEARHSINEVWALHRKLAQERHCLVVTASHTNKKTNERNIRQGDSSEESRKEGHITHGITLNQTDEEKRKGIYRIGAINIRNSGYSVNKFLYCTSCLEIGKPWISFL